MRSRLKAITATRSRRNLLAKAGLALLALAGLLTYLHLTSGVSLLDALATYAPFSELRYVQQAFEPTPQELACLRGTPTAEEEEEEEEEEDDDDAAPGQQRGQPIPDVVHYVYVDSGSDAGQGGGGRGFDFLAYLAVRSAIVTLKPEVINLHFASTGPLSLAEARKKLNQNPWVSRLRPHINIVEHPAGEISKQDHPAHTSDILRLQILQAQGGIYLDLDTYIVSPHFRRLLDPRPPHDIVMGWEGGNRLGLCNAIMAARPNSTFVRRWLASYAHADLSREWNDHSVRLPGQMAARYPDDICALPPDAFFWPTWTPQHVRDMHRPLPPREAAFWRAQAERWGGGLMERQVAFHAWSSAAWGTYLRRLDETALREEDTKFSILVRRFLEDAREEG